MADFDDILRADAAEEEEQLARIVEELRPLYDGQLDRAAPDLDRDRLFWARTARMMQLHARMMVRAHLEGAAIIPWPEVAQLVEHAALAIHQTLKGDPPWAWETPKGLARRRDTDPQLSAEGFAAAYYDLSRSGEIPDDDPKGTVKRLYDCAESTFWTFLGGEHDLHRKVLLRKLRRVSGPPEELAERRRKVAEKEITRAGNLYKRRRL